MKYRFWKSKLMTFDEPFRLAQVHVSSNRVTQDEFRDFYGKGMLSILSKTSTANIIVWLDGTIRPWRGHLDCDGVWQYDGQVFVYNCSCKERIKYEKTST